MRGEIRFRTFIAVLALGMSVAACDAISGREQPRDVDDTTITTEVVAEIIKDPSLKKFQVSVETLDHVVQLSGFVDSTRDAAHAGDLARNVSGVWSVKNDLIVR